jgi:hypothetical protein
MPCYLQTENPNAYKHLDIPYKVHSLQPQVDGIDPSQKHCHKDT